MTLPPASVISSRRRRRGAAPPPRPARWAGPPPPPPPPGAGDHAQAVPPRRGGLRPHDEIRPAEEVEVEGVVFHHEGAVHQLADLPRRGGRSYLEEGVEGLRRGHMVGRTGVSAEAGRDLGGLRPPCP